METLLTSLDNAQRFLIAFSLFMGIESPLLLFVAVSRGRRWYEQALALIPAGGFALGTYFAHNAQGAYEEWQNYSTWTLVAPSLRTDLQAVVANIQQQTVFLGALTVALLLGGCWLLVRWLSPLRPTVVAKAEKSSIVHEEEGSLEITVEPIERKRR